MEEQKLSMFPSGITELKNKITENIPFLKEKESEYADRYKLQKQHDKGKLHAIERIALLLDKDTFREIGSKVTNHTTALGLMENTLPYDGVITGYGTIKGQRVYIYSQDFTVMGGTLGNEHGKKIAHVIEMAIKSKCPIIGINDSGGARIQEGVNSLAGYGDIFYMNTLASGYIPQISIIAGPCAGGAVYSPGITDFIFTIDDVSNMFVTGPKVIKSVTNETVTADELGSAKVHSTTSGVAHFRYQSEESCYEGVRKLIEMIPQYYGDRHTFRQENYSSKSQKGLESILPERMSQSYDMRQVIEEMFDKDSFIEVQSEFAQNIVVGFAKLSNITVGVVGNQPNYVAGVLDCDASDKAARFIRFCDSYNIPIITLVDVPGFMPGVNQEMKGIIRHGAKLLYAYSEASTIKLTVVLRKAYGGAYIAMCSKHLHADYVYAWPSAEIAVMGAEGAVEIIHSKEMKSLPKGQVGQFINEKAAEYRDSCMNGEIAAQYGYVDEVIEPTQTRERLFSDLIMLRGKSELINVRKKHGNIPL
ncbi:acyl-CoA carboxylase subunit beta [Anaerosporobacter faecicola]|uniref:acyl-CoA carboxylase subunit beta n=1 Tax=Anaerosporobacter faecicola TaxID=2718714 RepID=UPI001EE51B73|nr:acyl-CoA carboxylase subunit beta [Anaerosporobacter faecicola]